MQRIRFINFAACVLLAVFFAWVARETLLPSAHLLAEAVGLGDYPAAVGAAFALLGALFAATGRAPERPGAAFPLSAPKTMLTLCLPMVLGLLYGVWHSDPPLWQRTGVLESVLWYVVFVPLGEEFLFRGGLYGALRRLGGDAPLTATNPLPVAVWASALAFALWHWEAGGYTVARTFFLGLWLGWLRWRMAGLRWPVLGHVAVNGAAILL